MLPELNVTWIQVCPPESLTIEKVEKLHYYFVILAQKCPCFCKSKASNGSNPSFGSGFYYSSSRQVGHQPWQSYSCAQLQRAEFQHPNKCRLCMFDYTPFSPPFGEAAESIP
ncbi:hypothetical protein VFPPC_15295 [Pochonia chlamydosporia 170]|uniref:Uncharacterized protein n=1 Tax=Pochonia chlamydosporia 170 TaxID=1380566 RepID=A0A179G786_METCM|nr:hypothetical protein VFPPC_15295 [Pochonia chlamydosporia 170]OAQ73370.1 hypothetical protein VFPPC_15295 [Pochonia chlamydosporia 170]